METAHSAHLSQSRPLVMSPIGGQSAAWHQGSHPPSVSIIVWHAGGSYIQSIAKLLTNKTSYPSFDLVIVGRVSKESGYFDLLHRVPKIVDARINTWTAAQNLGARYADGSVLFFADETLDTFDHDWLHNLVVQFEDPSVGIVAPMLLRPDGRVHSRGIYPGPGGASGLIGHGQQIHDDNGGLRVSECDREVCAVAGEALCIRRTVFWEMGGFNEDYANNYADIDLCLRSRQAGHRVICAAQSPIKLQKQAWRLAGILADRAIWLDRWANDLTAGDPTNLAREL